VEGGKRHLLHSYPPQPIAREKKKRVPTAFATRVKRKKEVEDQYLTAALQRPIAARKGKGKKKKRNARGVRGKKKWGHCTKNTIVCTAARAA